MTTVEVPVRGRNQFTPDEAVQIKALLCELRKADRDKQKSIRAKLRREYCFYISRFRRDNQGFTVANFKHCKSEGTLIITETPDRRCSK